MLKQILFFTFLGLVLAKKSYEGYKVFRTDILSARKAGSLQKLMLNSAKFDFWSEPEVGGHADIMAHPDDFDYLLNVFNSLGIQHEIFINNVEDLIQKEAEVQAAPKQEGPYSIDWKSYYPHEKIYQFIEEIAAKDTTYFRTKDIGKTYENRSMMALEMTRAGPGMPSIFIESNIHAREWISGAVATYLIRELVDSLDSALNNYLEKLNFYFVPIANPDGHAYTWNPDGDRLWRKNRSPNPIEQCPGVDLNRNFGFHFGESGTSDIYCGQTYNGETAFSEEESRHLSNYWNTVKTENGNVAPQLSVCFHSYSQLFLVPYGYATGALAPNYPAMESLANDANDALIAVHQTQFVVINSADLYPAAGAADDWYKSEGSNYTYTMELRDTGVYGFMLPPSQIEPSGEEMWAAFKVMLDEIIKVS